MEDSAAPEARRVLEGLQRGTLKRAEFSPTLWSVAGHALEDILKRGQTLVGAFGDVQSFTPIKTVPTPEGVAHVFDVGFAPQLTWIVSRDAAGTIDRLVLPRHSRCRIFSVQHLGFPIDV